MLKSNPFSLPGLPILAPCSCLRSCFGCLLVAAILIFLFLPIIVHTLYPACGFVKDLGQLPLLHKSSDRVCLYCLQLAPGPGAKKHVPMMALGQYSTGILPRRMDADTLPRNGLSLCLCPSCLCGLIRSMGNIQSLHPRLPMECIHSTNCTGTRSGKRSGSSSGGMHSLHFFGLVGVWALSTVLAVASVSANYLPCDSAGMRSLLANISHGRISSPSRVTN